MPSESVRDALLADGLKDNFKPWPRGIDTRLFAPAKRSPDFPDVPTLGEAGVADMEISLWTGIVAPINTPPEIVNTIAEAVHKMLTNPEMIERFSGPGIQVVWTGPQDFSAFVKNELVKCTATIKEAGIEPE